MWYFAWFLGTLLACAFGIIAALTIEYKEAAIADKQGNRNLDNNN